jgi:hypothetical protein
LRQFERFYQSFGSSQILSYSADYDVFKLAPQNINEQGIHIFSCTKTLINYFLKFKRITKSPVDYTNIKNTRLTYIQTDSLTTTTQSSLAYPSMVRLDNLNYHPMTTNSTSEKILSSLSNLENQTFQTTLHVSQSIYSILILLTLKNNKSF